MLFHLYTVFSAYAGYVFGTLAAGVVALSFLANETSRFRLSLLLFGAWFVTDVLATMLGYTSETLRTVASVDAVVAVFVAIIGYEARSRVALIIFSLYGLVFLTHVAAAVFGGQQTNTYYATLNILFFLQLATVGASSARRVLLHRRVRSHQRPRVVPMGGAGMAKG